MKYDYLIVGAGLFGAVFAHEAAKRGLKCLVIEKRNHIGGNIYTQDVQGIPVHVYGAHIFHTNDDAIWNYVNQFAEFNDFINSPIANFKGKKYNLPFNMNTFKQMWGVTEPAQAQEIIARQVKEAGIVNPSNLEEQAISLVGVDIYNTLIKGYTEKQWGRKATDLPAFIIKRIPVRFTYDNNYFSDKYQGIPTKGYTELIGKMLKDADVHLSCDYFDKKDYYDSLADKVIFCGMIDRYFNYRYGALSYRSLRFDSETLPSVDYQGVAVMNYTSADVPYTRIIEHKHFVFDKTTPVTVVTKEYPVEWKQGDEPYYPVNDDVNQALYAKYADLAKQDGKVIFGGRLGMYRYLDMDKIIAEALKAFNSLHN